VTRFLLACAVLLALSPRAVAEPRWTMVRTPSLTVIGDQSPGTLRDVAIQIEQFRSVVAGLIRNADRPLPLPTIVFVFGERKSLQPFVPLYNGKPIELAGYFHGDLDANVVVLSLEGFEESASVVYHELTHLLVRNAVRSIPTWLNEGLAEYYSGYKLEAGGKSAVVGRPLGPHLLLLRERYMPLAELLAVDESSPLYNEGSKRSIFYAESWALTHYAMMQMPDGPAALNRYSAAIAEGTAPSDAFRDAFSATPAEFDKQLRDYVSRFRFGIHYFEFTEKMTAIKPGPPRTLSAGEANAWLGDLQRRVERVAEASTRIEMAVKADPSAPIAQAALGLLRLSQHRDGEGLAVLRHAAELAPDDFLVQIAYGSWLLRANTVEDQAAEAAIPPLTRATALNPNSADAYAWLAYAQMMSKSSLPAARASIERAIALAPGRIEYRLRWADVRILEGSYEDAKAMLSRLAAVTFDPAAATGAASRLDRLAQFERAEAARLAAWQEAQANAARFAEAANDARARRTIETPGIDDPTPSETDARPVLRKVKTGEDRAFGTLIRVDCTPSEVKFHMRSNDRTITAIAKRMEDVELTQFVNDKEFTVSCGSRIPPDTIYLTWRRDPAPVAGRAGVAVSIEFLPRGYVP
jgi:tetratricopeptide (TPR) repeat protein